MFHPYWMLLVPLPKGPHYISTQAEEAGACKKSKVMYPYSCSAEWVTPLKSHLWGPQPPPPLPSQGPEPVSRLPGGSADVALGSCLGPGSRADVTQPRGGGGSPGGRARLLARQDYLLPLRPGSVCLELGRNHWAQLTRVRDSLQFLCVATDSAAASLIPPPLLLEKNGTCMARAVPPVKAGCVKPQPTARHIVRAQ